MWLERSRAQHLTGLVRGGREDGRARSEPEGCGRAGGELAEPASRRDELGQPGRIDGRRRPSPVTALRPRQPLVVERDVADLARDRIDEATGQPMRQEAGT